MKRFVSIGLGSFAAVLFSLTAAAQSDPGTGASESTVARPASRNIGSVETPSAHSDKAIDCGKARDPARCEALVRVYTACKDKKRGAERQACLKDQMPPPDCSKAANPQRCETRQKLSEACKGKSGKELRDCLRNQRASGKSDEPAK